MVRILGSQNDLRKHQWVGTQSEKSLTTASSSPLDTSPPQWDLGQDRGGEGSEKVAGKGTEKSLKCLRVTWALQAYIKGEWINEFERQSLNWRNPSLLEPELVKNVLAARDGLCINPLTSYYPRWPIMGKANSSNFKIGWDRGVWVPGALKLDHLQPIEPFLFLKIFIFFSFILGGQF